MSPTHPHPSSLLISGAALLMAGNAVHPLDADPSATSRLTFAADPAWPIIHLVIAVGVVLATAGLLGVLRPPPGSARSAITDLGALAVAAGGTAMAVVFAALDGYAVAALAKQWEQTSDTGREGLHAAAVALEAIDSGLAGFGTLLLFGVGLLAVATTLRTRGGLPTPTWIVAAVLGVAGTVTGVLLLVQGPTPTTINLLLRPVAGATTLFFLGLGLLLRRGIRNRPSARGGRSDTPDRPASLTPG